MFKKIVFAGLILLSSPALAKDAGFYVAPSVFVVDATSSTSSAIQVSPRFSIGYANNFSQYYYLGGELFVNPGSVMVSKRETYGRPTLQTTYSLGASLLPGVRLNETSMLFFRIGGVETHFVHKNNNDLGLQVGIGIQTTVSYSWSIRGEYIYNTYYSMTGISAPRADWYGIGGVYRFD